MKRNLLLLVLSLFLGINAQAQIVLSKYHVAPSVAVHMPVLGDSINLKGAQFTVNELLKTPMSLDLRNQETQLISADTTGYVSLAKADEGSLFYLLETNLRAESFTYATLKMFSSVRFEVYVNGQMKQTNPMASDTITKIRPVMVNLRMEPETSYKVVIKLLSMADDKMKPMLKCELDNNKNFKGVALHEGPDIKRRLSLYETAFNSRVNLLSLSPNGKYLLMGTVDNYSAKRGQASCVLLDTKTQKVVMSNVPNGARWMPQSNKLFFLENAEVTKNLVSYDPETGVRTVIQRNIPEGTFRWSPTEDYLIYSKADINQKGKSPLNQLLMPDDRIAGARNRSYLMKYDLKSGLSERLTYGSQSVSFSSISHDGKKILCISRQPNITEHPFNLYTLFELNLETMKADTLISKEAYLDAAHYSPDDSQLLLIGSPEAFGGIGKNCGNLPIANGYDKQAYLFDMATRKITPITRDFNPSIEYLQWNQTDGCIYFNTTDEDCKNIYRYVPSKNIFEKLPLKEDVINSFSLPKDAPKMAAYIGGGNTSVGVAYIYDMKKKTSTLLANPMAERLEGVQFGEMSEWYFTAQNGSRIKGMKCLPPNFDPEKKYPLIVYYYGGTTPTTRGMTSPYCAQLFAARGYVVYVIQPSGTIGFGQEFSARHVNAWGDWTADEIIEGTKKFCEEHSFVDSKKIGCIGASYGGFMTQYLQTKTDLFAAAVSHAGISNVTSYWGEGYWGYSYNSVAAAKSYPWNNPDLFVKHGSLFNADKINTPLLLLHGSVDTNVPIGESIQLYNALKILGKEVEFITVNGEDHFVADYNNRLLWHNTIMAWFARWLKDSPQWWNELYPKQRW
ncbi:MAG: S9 family peptidase [Bacteroidaceae bacterium]|nr:S9 family peptidase [Bacteroidaceae bacterium]